MDWSKSYEARSALETAFATICRSIRRLGGLAVSNALCKFYIKLDEIQMVIVFQSRVHSQLTCPFDDFTREDKVMWKYYSGLVALERLKFKEAEECLGYALENMSMKHFRSVQKLICLLIPVHIDIPGM